MLKQARNHNVIFSVLKMHNCLKMNNLKQTQSQFKRLKKDKYDDSNYENKSKPTSKTPFTNLGQSVTTKKKYIFN